MASRVALDRNSKRLGVNLYRHREAHSLEHRIRSIKFIECSGCYGGVSPKVSQASLALQRHQGYFEHNIALCDISTGLSSPVHWLALLRQKVFAPLRARDTTHFQHGRLATIDHSQAHWVSVPDMQDLWPNSKLKVLPLSSECALTMRIARGHLSEDHLPD